MPPKSGAPLTFHGPLRAPLQARETLLPRVAGRATGFGSALGLAVLDVTGFPAPAAWAPGPRPPGWLPTRGRVSGGLGRQRQPAPPALHRPCWGTARFRGRRAAMPLPYARLAPWRGSPGSLGFRPVTARRRLAAIYGTDCHQIVRGVAAESPRLPASAQGTAAAACCRLSPSPTHGDREPGRPARQGLRHFVRTLRPVPSGCGLGRALAFWLSSDTKI